MYSASHVEEATKFWRFDGQTMSPCSQNATKPDVERRMSRQGA